MPNDTSWLSRRSLRRLSLAGVVTFGVISVLLALRKPAFALVAVGATLGFAVYYRFGPASRSVIGPVRLDRDWVDDPRLPSVLTVLFLLALSLSVWTLGGAYYGKPLVFYLGVAAAAGILVVRLSLTDARTSTFGLTVLFGAVVYSSNQLAFPLGLNGPDIGDHVSLTSNIVETGYVVGETVYTGFPGQHILAGSITLVGGLPTQFTYRLLGLWGMFLVLPLAYLTARKLTGEWVAILSVLVYASMEYVVYRAGHPSKLAYALPLVALLFATVVALTRSYSPPWLVLFALFSTALVFTHHHTAFVTGLFLVTLGIGSVVSNLDVGRRLESLSTSFRSPLGDGGDRADLQVMGNDLWSPPKSNRTHVLALLFGIAFLSQFLYFSQFYDALVGVASQYVDVLFEPGGTDQLKQTVRFATIPLHALVLNTIGSGLLSMVTVLGALELLRRESRLGLLLTGWLVVAGVSMAGGVLLNVPFALPNRVYVITELTGIGLIATVGISYLHGRFSTPDHQTAVAVVTLLVVGFVFFSTASTIAGIETSPFADDVPHRTWYEMSEEVAAESFVEDLDRSLIYARGLPLDPATEQFDYDTVEEGQLVGLNRHRIRTGIPVAGGAGRIGTGRYIVPEFPAAGLDNTTKLYDNGPLELYTLENETVR